jgi:protein-arginine kinase activator protein McsA
MVKCTGEMLCEICNIRPATETLPRGPKSEGHMNVCDDCAAKLYKEV